MTRAGPGQVLLWGGVLGGGRAVDTWRGRMRVAGASRGGTWEIPRVKEEWEGQGRPWREQGEGEDGAGRPAQPRAWGGEGAAAPGTSPG